MGKQKIRWQHNVGRNSRRHTLAVRFPRIILTSYRPPTRLLPPTSPGMVWDHGVCLRRLNGLRDTEASFPPWQRPSRHIVHASTADPFTDGNSHGDLYRRQHIPVPAGSGGCATLCPMVERARHRDPVLFQHHGRNGPFIRNIYSEKRDRLDFEIGRGC